MNKTFLPTLILRHRKENLKKCSLRGLESRFTFLTYPIHPLPDLSDYTLLSPDAPPLESASNLFLIDGTWAHAEKMAKTVPPTIRKRSLPGWVTAYPRRQEITSGLASIEALFAAFHTLGYPTDGLLDNYYWKEAFLTKNAPLIGLLT